LFWPSPTWDEVTYWALDLETGGLDAAHDAILAVGMVPIRAGVVRLAEAYETLVRPSENGHINPTSVQAHQLVPREVVDAPPLGDVVLQIERRLREDDCALLVHNAGIDVRFLRQAYRVLKRSWIRPRVVDTVELLVKSARKTRFVDPSAQQREPELNLAGARKLLGLPEYGAHDALIDAISTAELFLVLRRALKARTLRDLT
jgi:DNA polymerase-3 subunit epsilon